MRTCVRYLSFIWLPLFFTLTLPSESTSQWRRVEAPLIEGTYFWGIEFESGSTGYAIGSRANSIFLYKTTDGGSTWKTLKGLGVVPFTFTFVDESTGFAAGRSAGCKCMAISRTTDGGATWKLDSMETSTGTIDQIPSDRGINAISFSTKRDGFAVGVNGLIVRTNDGGATWTPLAGINQTDFFVVVAASTPRTAHAVALTNDEGLALYRTADSGSGWDRSLDFVALATADMVFTGPKVGFVVGSDGASAIYKTSDGGVTWTRKYAVGDSESIFTRIAFENETTGYAVGSEGRIVRTTDGGETWIAEESGTSDLLQGITIRDGVAYAISTEGTLLRRAVGASSVPSKSGDVGDVMRLTVFDVRF